MTNYLILSNDKVVIDNSINKIIKESKLKDYELIKYDLTECELDNVIEELDTHNFLSDNKVIVLYNAIFIEDSKENKNLLRVIKYLNNPNPDNIFVMVATTKRSGKEINELLSKVTLIETNLSPYDLVKNNLEDYTMDSRAIKELVDLSLNNNEKIINELNKLKLYRIDTPTKQITYEDVKNIVIEEFNDNAFDLVTAITNKNKEKAFSLYNRLIVTTDSTILVASIVTKVKTLYQVKVLSEEGYKKDEIQNITGTKNIWTINYALNECNNFSSKKLLRLLKDLSDIDYKSKSQNIDVDFLFKMFLLSL